MNRKVESLAYSLEELFNCIIDQIGTISFDKNHPQQLYAICLFGSILEASLACLKLLKDEKTHSIIPVLARNILEAYIDLINLGRSPEYAQTMNATYLDQKKKLFSAAVMDGEKNPFLKELANYEELNKDYEELKQQLAGLKSRGIEPIRIKEKFERAGLENQYIPVYYFMCQHLHNNLSVLEKRHIKKTNGEHNVHFFQKWEEKDLLPYLGHISRILSDSLLTIGNLLEITDDLDIKSIETALNNFDKVSGVKS